MSAVSGATGLIGTAIGIAALGLALGFVVKAARGELFDGRDRRKSSRSSRRSDGIGFDFGSNMTGRKPKSTRSSDSQNIFDLGLTQRPAKRKTKFKDEFGSDFNIFAV